MLDWSGSSGSLNPKTAVAWAALTFPGRASMSMWFHCIGTHSREVELGVGLGDQLYSQEIFEPGLVKGKTGSILSTGQQRPRLLFGDMKI